VLAEREDVEVEPVSEGGVADSLSETLAVSIRLAGRGVGLDVAEGDDAEFYEAVLGVGALEVPDVGVVGRLLGLDQAVMMASLPSVPPAKSVSAVGSSSRV
jgi:hypothetical protein